MMGVPHTPAARRNKRRSKGMLPAAPNGRSTPAHGNVLHQHTGVTGNIFSALAGAPREGCGRPTGGRARRAEAKRTLQQPGPEGHALMYVEPFFVARLLVCLLVLLCGLRAETLAQRGDTANTVTILINNADLSTSIADSANLMKLSGHVDLKQGGNQLLCDSAIFNLAANNVEAFGTVRILQPGGTTVESDYLRYTGNTRQAYLRGNVHLTDGKNSLWSEELTYNTATKVGVYGQGGTLQSESTTLSSNSGTYNVRTKDARFTGGVYVTDPRYNTVSDDLGYNTNTKLVTFFGPSIVSNDRSELRTTRGTYDSNKEVGHFTSRSSIRNEDQYVEGDKLDYDRSTGYGLAVGNVIALDTTQHTTLFAGRASYNEKRRTLLATLKPVLRKENGKDSILMRADTFYSAPVALLVAAQAGRQAGKGLQDSTRAKKKHKAPYESIVAEEQDAAFAPAPGSAADTAGPRYFTGYRHVVIWSDSLQGRCDSISYSQHDSVMRMMKSPVAWSRNSQITGDTLLLYTDSGQLSKIYIPNNALVVSISGPPAADLYDQVQGKTLTGYLSDGALEHMEVYPEAESIYYPKDDAGRYLGVNQSSAEKMRVYFLEQDINRIVLEQNVQQTITPMAEANLPAMRLSRFQWLIAVQPKSRAEIFE